MTAAETLAPDPGPPIGGSAPPDMVAGSDTSLLAGYRFEYRYTTGREYRLDFTAAEVTFTMLDAPVDRPELAAPISLPYHARAIRDGQLLVHWLVPGRVGHVALIIDLAENRIYVSALMPAKAEFFDTAQISLVERS